MNAAKRRQKQNKTNQNIRNKIRLKFIPKTNSAWMIKITQFSSTRKALKTSETTPCQKVKQNSTHCECANEIA